MDVGLTVALLMERLRLGERTFVITANPEFVMLARRDEELAQIAMVADLVVPDGTGVVVASRLLGDPLPARAPGRLIIDSLMKELAEAGSRVFLLGAASGVAERAALELRRRHPTIQIAGTFAGIAGPAGDDQTVASVNSATPDVLLVAYGMPAQERWIARNLARLPSVRIAIGIGGVLDQLAGIRRTPPRFVHRVGLEWLWRLASEPARWRRQLVLPTFVWFALRDRLLGR